MKVYLFCLRAGCLALAVASAALCAPAPAAGQARLLGYRCKVTKEIGGGWLEGERYIKTDGTPREPRLSWTIPDSAERKGVWTNVIFSAVETPLRVVEVVVDYNYYGVPTQPLWLTVRMGQTLEQKLLWQAPTGTLVGSSALVHLSGPALEHAYEAGNPLRVYVQRQDGRVEYEKQLALAKRILVESEAATIRAAVEKKAAEFRSQCQPDWLDPLP